MANEIIKIGLNKAKFVFFLTAIISGACLFNNESISKASASEFALGIYPPVIKLNSAPGSNLSTPITLQNLGENTVELEIIIKPFEQGDSKNGQPEIIWIDDENDDAEKYQLLFENIKFTDEDTIINEVVLAPTQKKNIVLSMRTPESTNGSEYYFSILFMSKSSIAADLSHSQISGGIASNILLSVGDENINARLQEFSFPYISINPEPEFKVKIENMGKHYISPSGRIEIKNIFGSIVKDIKIDQFNILSGTIRETKPKWNDSPLIGFYTAELKLNLNEKNNYETTKRIVFAIIPLIHVLILTSAIVVLIIFSKRFKNKN